MAFHHPACQPLLRLVCSPSLKTCQTAKAASHLSRYHPVLRRSWSLPPSCNLRPLHVVDVINLFSWFLLSSLHSTRAERGGVFALRPAYTVHPSLSQTQHLPSSSAFQSMSSSTSFFPSLLCCSLSVHLSVMWSCVLVLHIRDRFENHKGCQSLK